ncbi:MAG TPA: bifunctional adenosylcobinamide kinase/adenosylcobinamide-phosphate guanylyltransferase [Nocardioidaceae bacterium]|nr:bifunctional adenosylcobinamide kinase/adenosylcobinamide-phosphate guanylyltransferase [Nocardioidaceae bacterium]
MDVLTLGTGSADGWPNPFCTCASCTAERAAGRVRGQTAALVDGRLLLDLGPETPRAAERTGVDLSAVRHVLITHQHPDHCSPAFLLFRSWAADGPLDVVGPPGVVEACRMWVAPDSPVSFHAVAPGDRLTLGGYDVQVHAARHGAAGTAVLYDVAASGGRLLYATDTAALPDDTVAAVTGAAFDVVLMEETFGDLADHDTDHLHLATFAEQLRRLRSVGAVTEHTDVVAVHLSHHNPPTAELSRRLADWGARVVDDGTWLAAGPVLPRAAAIGHSRRTLVIGGARSGKSREAERLLAAEPAVTYLATAYPLGTDDEWDARVRRHRADRPSHWRTEETLDLVGVLSGPGEPLLVDCLTLWLTRVMDRHDAWDDGVWATRGEKAVMAEIDDLLSAWRATRRRVVAVTNEVGQGVVPETVAGRRFRDLMGRLNAAVAAETEDVRWCVAGRVTSL